jgi:hypothetical protein
MRTAPACPRGARALPGDACGRRGDLGGQRCVGEHRQAQAVTRALRATAALPARVRGPVLRVTLARLTTGILSLAHVLVGEPVSTSPEHARTAALVMRARRPRRHRARRRAPRPGRNGHAVMSFPQLWRDHVDRYLEAIGAAPATYVPFRLSFEKS